MNLLQASCANDQAWISGHQASTPRAWMSKLSRSTSMIGTWPLNLQPSKSNLRHSNSMLRGWLLNLQHSILMLRGWLVNLSASTVNLLGITPEPQSMSYEWNCFNRQWNSLDGLCQRFDPDVFGFFAGKIGIAGGMAAETYEMPSKLLRFCFAPAERSLGSARRMLYDPRSRLSAAPKIGNGIKIGSLPAT